MNIRIVSRRGQTQTVEGEFGGDPIIDHSRVGDEFYIQLWGKDDEDCQITFSPAEARDIIAGWVAAME